MVAWNQDGGQYDDQLTNFTSIEESTTTTTSTNNNNNVTNNNGSFFSAPEDYSFFLSNSANNLSMAFNGNNMFGLSYLGNNTTNAITSNGTCSSNNDMLLNNNNYNDYNNFQLNQATTSIPQYDFNNNNTQSNVVQTQQVVSQVSQPMSVEQSHISIEYTQPNDIISGQMYNIDGQLHCLSDYSSPADVIFTSPGSSHVPSSPSDSYAIASNTAVNTSTTTTTTYVASPPESSASQSTPMSEELDDSSEESDSEEAAKPARPSKKRKNSFDPDHNYGPILPKHIQLEISSKEFEVYRKKFYSGKLSKEVSNNIKNQERKIKNRESAQKSREKKSKNMQVLEDKLMVENSKKQDLESKLQEANIKNSYLMDEVRNLKEQLARERERNASLSSSSSSPTLSFFDENSKSSLMGSFSSLFSIGNGIPTVAGGQRLACFFLLFLIVIFTSSSGFQPHNAGHAGVSGVQAASYPFRMPQYLNRGLQSYQQPTESQLKLMNRLFDSRLISDWNGHANSDITISYTPNAAPKILKRVLENKQQHLQARAELPKQQPIDVNNNNNNNNNNVINNNNNNGELIKRHPSNTPTIQNNFVEQRFHSTQPEIKAEKEMCDAPVLPNNSSVKISIRSNYKITSPDGNNNHSMDSFNDPEDLVSRNADPSNFNYRELNVDVELLFPSKEFENGSNDISKLLLNAGSNGQPLRIVANVLDMTPTPVTAGNSNNNNNNNNNNSSNKDTAPMDTIDKIQNLASLD
ncbi:hypothetical protein SAMD00019534_012490 [Acytostelium subglobosum LB1]|uniref:hypothetical protein n=1 Tax=Acytostelium subglobosum LB1 TaxID=1410327 RepID=UPI0006451061|nr:hypothetical protein SAMD00019534_012490 [Acytostelium subglobosum LB1]GAM18074.1 hypothetical protein SAMD00019534_012490 [Acytostelium subglobosum LB1]|eukprot:XP_012758670.1 hypothetical protein SAMD00019534_012490 [Acytostelium subglobosum LB1]